MEQIYDQINEFRRDPARFQPSCVVPAIKLKDLVIDSDLEAAAKWQATHQCGPARHTTCPRYCHLFGGRCDHISRITHFTKPRDVSNLNELLVQGPRRPFRHLVESIGHCEQLLSPTENIMGGAIAGNLFVLALGWSRRRPNLRNGTVPDRL